MNSYKENDTSFWRDDFVMGLPRSEKLFYIYLMSNVNARLYGVFKLPIKKIERETGIDKDTINMCIDNLESCHRIIYNRQHQQVMILKC